MFELLRFEIYGSGVKRKCEGEIHETGDDEQKSYDGKMGYGKNIRR